MMCGSRLPNPGLRNWVARLLEALVLLTTAAVTPTHAQTPSFAGRPGLAAPEQVPAETATCENPGTALAGFPSPSARVDLWVTGELSLVHTDGALWYLVVCSPPGVRVMCVTYSDNGMRLGERVTLRGAYRPQDELHVLLDPCLASRS
jgi:hypothetical protein